MNTTEIENESDEGVAKRLQAHFDRHTGLEVDLDETVARLRTRRENAGAGVNRLDMSFKGRGYATKQSKLFQQNKTSITTICVIRS